MFTIDNFQIIIGAISFIIILIVLGKISRQLDNISSCLGYIQKKAKDTEDTTKWAWDIIKAKLEILIKELEKEKKEKKEIKNNDIKWV
ncbi:MAG: hypothetical protein AB1349_05245 [Elusimicrobiota bacterium]